MFKRPRLQSRQTFSFFDKGPSHWIFRYGIAVAASAITISMSVFFGDRLGVEFYLLVHFAIVLATTVFGGLGPGLLITLVVSFIGYQVPRRHLNIDELHLLTIGAVLVSIGATLRT